jgi:predicted deacetylase
MIRRGRVSPQNMTDGFPQIDLSRSFCVMLHDVAPIFAPQVAAFTRAMAPLVGNTMSAAVVPCWSGEPLAERDRPFLEKVREEYADLLLHGYEHFRPAGRGLVSAIADGKDEMNGLDPAETDRRLAAGQEIFARWLGRPARGFIAPTYRIGHATPERLAQFGIHYTVGYRQVVTSTGQRLPLSSWVWDVSPVRLLCRAGYRLGELQYRFRRRALPCVVLHPLDLERGFLPQIERTVQKLLCAGRQPVLLESMGYGVPASPAAA